MEQTQDGFELAEQDLLIRGTGELFGLAQSGLPDLKVANIIKDIPILVEAREDAKMYYNPTDLMKYNRLCVTKWKHVLDHSICVFYIINLTYYMLFSKGHL